MLVADLEDRITYREFMGWLAYFRQQREAVKEASKPKTGPNLLDMDAAQLSAMFKAE